MSPRVLPLAVLGLLMVWPALGQNEEEQRRAERVSRLFNIEAMIDSHARLLAKRYNLTPEQDAFTTDFLHAKAVEFLDRHRNELFGLIDEMITVRTTGEMSKEALIAWGRRALPLYEEAKLLIVDGNDEWREILTDEQKVIHDKDLEDMYRSFDTTDEQLSRIVAGQMTVEEFLRGPRTPPPREDRNIRPPTPAPKPPEVSPQPPVAKKPEPAGGKTTGAAPPAGVPRPSRNPVATPSSDGGRTVTATPPGPTPSADRPGPGGRRVNAPADPRGQKAAESEWETYVRNFIEKYRLNEAQTQQAQSILRKCQEQADRIMRRTKPQIERLDEELKELATSKDPDKLKRLSELRERRSKLLAAINDIFEKQLKPQLERLPTTAQRKAAETAKAGDPGRRSSPPGDRSTPKPEPRPMPEPVPEPEPEPEPEPVPEDTPE